MGSVKITGTDMTVFKVLLWQQAKSPSSYKQTQQTCLLKTVPQPSVTGVHRLIWQWCRLDFSNCLTDLSAWSSSSSTFFFLDLGMILFRADCLSCGVGSLKDTMSSMSSIAESHADGMIICQSHRKGKSQALDVVLYWSAVYRNEVRSQLLFICLPNFFFVS